MSFTLRNLYPPTPVSSLAQYNLAVIKARLALSSHCGMVAIGALACSDVRGGGAENISREGNTIADCETFCSLNIILSIYWILTVWTYV